MEQHPFPLRPLSNGGAHHRRLSHVHVPTEQPLEVLAERNHLVEVAFGPAPMLHEDVHVGIRSQVLAHRRAEDQQPSESMPSGQVGDCAAGRPVN